MFYPLNHVFPIRSTHHIGSLHIFSSFNMMMFCMWISVSQNPKHEALIPRNAETSTMLIVQDLKSTSPDQL